MIKAIFWKEWREQRLTVAMLMAAGCALIITLGQTGLFGMTASTEIAFRTPVGHMVVMLLVAAAGLVCGAALFATERESRTQTFLDQLPVTRGRIWRAKVAFGLALTLAQLVILVAAAWWADLFGREATLWLPVYVGFGLLAFAWGLFGSAMSNNVLAAAGVAILGIPVGMVIIGFAVALLNWVYKLPRIGETDTGGVALVAVLSGVLAVGLSAAVYTRPGGRRRTVARSGKRIRPGVGHLVWLLWRQSRGLGFTLVPLSLLAGLSLLVPGSWGIVTWPGLTLLIGWLCGVAAFGDEQMSGVQRLWGEQRLPALRVWFAKVVTYFGIAFGATLLALVPGYAVVLVAAAGQSGNAPMDPLSGVMFSELPLIYPDQRTNFLHIWVVYGFVAGLAARLFFPKPFVAGPVALSAAVVSAGLWAPSMITGGLHWWQVWTPPLIVLVGTAFFARLWARNRLGSPTGVAAIGVCLLLAAGSQALGIAYRVWEIPDAPDRLAESGFVESLPDPAEDEARQLFLEAAGDFSDALRDITPESRNEWEASQWISRIGEAAREDGWPAATASEADNLDRLFAYPWDERLSALPDLPLGVIEMPGRSANAVMDHSREFRWMNEALAARGLQRQAAGDHQAFLDNLTVGLALIRNYRNKGVPWVTFQASGAERRWIEAHTAWLDALGDRPELLRQSAAIWGRHDAETPPPGEDLSLAAQLSMRNSLMNPQEWLPYPGNRYPADNDLKRLRRERDAELVLTAMQVPWETERLRRLHRLAWTAPDDEMERDQDLNRALVDMVRLFRDLARRAEVSEKSVAADRRAARLTAALRLYRAEQGRPAERLGQLVPEYLDAIPADPFDGQPFRYRLSAGEVVNLNNMEPTELLPGDAVLWSVGQDGADDGGYTDQEARPVGYQVEGRADRIYLIPRR